MVSSNSPSSEKSATPRKSKTLLLRLFLWIKRFLDERKLPYVANQACRVYFGKKQSSRRKCQSILQTSIVLDGHQLQRFLQTSIGDRLLSWISPLFHFPDQPNAKYGLRQLFLEMAGQPEGISLLQLLHLVPERTQINLDQLMVTAGKIEDLTQTTDLLVSKIRAIAPPRSIQNKYKPLQIYPICGSGAALRSKHLR
ncbi:MAG: alpha/beta hydrolase [Limnothrix sp. RL_2_0]|nr:alpha/beta hydrolase [Limnothrix sp. RL_2_0]